MLTKKQILDKYNKLPFGSIVFVYGKGFLSKGISIFQKFESLRDLYLVIKRYRELDLSFYHPTHCEIKIGMTVNISAEAEGVCEVPFERLLNKEVGIAFGYPILDSDSQLEETLRICDYCEEQIGVPYDFAGLFGFLWRVPVLGPFLEKLCKGKLTHWKVALFCSELCAEAYSLTYFLRPFKEELSKVSPLELEKAVLASPNMKFEIVRTTKDAESSQV